MRLKQLELYGFKTFADSTTLVFDEGVTAIIGPNGSGKSNCADALLWVLAERRMSTLRASEGTDVIFAGASGRRPLGYAEVTLTIDNSDRSLPVDLGEVEVTRRVHRNGDAEYLLGHRRCRRKDIVDLFLDTGVGRQAFSVISQREIDALLSLEATDRRRLLEEIAGIERYRSRRDETMRRLKDTEDNLTRLGDVMVGLEMQLGPLAAQKQTATKYLALRERVEKLKLSLVVKDYQLLERRLLRGDEELQALEQAITAAGTALSEGEAAEERARLDQLKCDDELQHARQALGESAHELERHETAVRVGEERLKNYAERLAAASQARSRHLARQAEQEQETGVAAAALAEVKGELEIATTQSAELEAVLRQRREAERQAETALEALRRELTEVERRSGVLEAQRRAGNQTIEVATGRAAGLAERQRETATKQAELGQANVAAMERVETAQAEVGRLSAEHQALTRQRAELQRADARSREQAGELRARRSEVAARLRILHAAADSYEGLFGGVKAVLKARDRGRLRGDYQVIADLLQVADGCDVAIESALGPRLQDLVCDSAEDAQAAIEYLKQERAGRATFLPLDLLDPTAPPRDSARLRQLPGVVGLGLDLVTAPADYELVRQHLLANTIVTEDLDAAFSVRREGCRGATIVTLDGDLVRTSGAVSGGSREQRGPGLLERRREIATGEREHERLGSELAAVEAEAQSQAQRGRELDDAQAAVTEQLSVARRELSEAERTRIELRSASSGIEAELTRLAETASELGADREQAARTVAEATAELAELTARREALGRQLAGSSESAQQARRERTSGDESLSALQVRAARLESRLQSLEEAAAARERARQTAQTELARLEREIEVLSRERRRVEAELASQKERWTILQSAQQERAKTVEAHLAARRDTEQAVKAAVDAVRAARTELAEAQQQHHRAELRRTQVDTELQLLREELAEDHHGLTPEQAASQADEITNRAEAASELQTWRDEMEAMGDVNLGAIDEFERISEQLLFYEKQRADLREAKDDLLTVIAEIDEVTREKLAEAYRDVNREFGVLFKRVFGEDGEASLEWTDPDEILDSGLEVLVRLPGKRAQTLLLLSGGERAMTTITLLLAMFKVKPSPFCLLDELDAPLDEANLRKYRELLREFSATSQFIVITHNPETTRVANALYGITMEEPGVSRAYSYRPPASDEAAPEAAIQAAD